MCADVMAAAESGTGDWWFWFGWAERIAPAGAPDTAAAVIVTELRRQAGPVPRPSPAGAALAGYQACHAQLAGHTTGGVFRRAAAFLTLTAANPGSLAEGPAAWP